MYYSLLSRAYLYKSPFIQSTEDKERVRGPFHVRYLVQAGVELQDLQGAHIPHHKPVLHTGSLSGKLREKKRKEKKIWLKKKKNFTDTGYCIFEIFCNAPTMDLIKQHQQQDL